MSKLDSKQFGELLLLTSKADEKQLKQLKTLINLPAEERSTFLEMFKEVVERSTTTVVEKAKKEKTQVSVDKKVEEPIKTHPRTRSIKRVEIIAPQGVQFFKQIPFSIERFKHYLNNNNIKSAPNYANGMRKLLRDCGFVTDHISLNDLIRVRDFIGIRNSRRDSTKRGWLRKFNQYLVYEYQLNR